MSIPPTFHTIDDFQVDKLVREVRDAIASRSAFDEDFLDAAQVLTKAVDNLTNGIGEFLYAVRGLRKAVEKMEAS